jgi:hypothetical protein
MTGTVLGANIRLVFGLQRNTMPFSGPTMTVVARHRLFNTALTSVEHDVLLVTRLLSNGFGHSDARYHPSPTMCQYPRFRGRSLPRIVVYTRLA